MGYLYESWNAAQCDWKRSTVYLRVSSKTGSRRFGVKKWLSKAQLASLHGAEVAELMILHNTEHQPDEVRDHPDCPGMEAGTPPRYDRQSLDQNMR